MLYPVVIFNFYWTHNNKSMLAYGGLHNIQVLQSVLMPRAVMVSHAKHVSGTFAKPVLYPSVPR